MLYACVECSREFLFSGSVPPKRCGRCARIARETRGQRKRAHFTTEMMQIIDERPEIGIKAIRELLVDRKLGGHWSIPLDRSLASYLKVVVSKGHLKRHRNKYEIIKCKCCNGKKDDCTRSKWTCPICEELSDMDQGLPCKRCNDKP
jgi:hypothetical protein